jgi:hypothetical protein
LALHFVIALTWAGIFYAASHKFEILDRLPIICGLLYGGGMYVFMNLVVLPLSGVAHAVRPISIASRINGVLVVVLLIVLTISPLVHRNFSAGTERRSWPGSISHFVSRISVKGEDGEIHA